MGKPRFTEEQIAYTHCTLVAVARHTRTRSELARQVRRSGSSTAPRQGRTQIDESDFLLSAKHMRWINFESYGFFYTYFG